MTPEEQEQIEMVRQACLKHGQTIHTYKQVIETTVNRLVERAEEAKTLDELDYIYRSLSDLLVRLDDLLFSSKGKVKK